MALDPQQPGQDLPLDPRKEPELNIPQNQSAPQGPQVQPVQPAPQTSPAQPVIQPSTSGPVTPGTLEGRMAAANTPAAPSADTEEPVFTPIAEGQSDVPVEDLIKAQHRRSRVIWLTVSLLVIIALVVAGFFLLQPKTETPAPQDTEPVVTEPATTLAHTSSFVIAPTATIAATVSTAPTRDEILGVLVREGQRAGIGLTEITLSDSEGNQIPVNVFFAALAPGFPNGAAADAVFASDFTAFIYKDSAGVWPGYVLTQKQDNDAAVINQWLTSIETSTLSEFFAVDPGAFKGFRSGEVNGIADRYNPGSTANASFGYLANNGVVLIATSFDGMKEAVRLLGF